MAVITTRHGDQILVDDEDIDALPRVQWFVNAEGYAQGAGRIAGRNATFYMHRELMGLPRGDKRRVDHINGDRRDNRRSNLRVCSNRENLRNRGKTRKNTSGFKGVYKEPRRENKWRAQINIGGKDKYLGVFATREEAAEAYRKAAIEHHGEFANFD